MDQFLKSLSDRTRLKITAVLTKGEFSVMDIMDILEMGQSRISRHLKILSDSGIITSRRDGTWIFYKCFPEKGIKQDIIDSLIKWFKFEEEFKSLFKKADILLKSKSDKSRKFFSRIGSNWQAIRNRYIDQALYIRLLKDAAEKVKIFADLGCGTGETIKILAENECSFIGIDNSQEMLAEAKKVLKNLPGERVSLRLGNMEYLPLKENEVDGLLVSMVLHHIPQPGIVFNEFQRVLSPGGKITIIDFLKHKDEKLRKEEADIWLGFSKNEITTWFKESRFSKINVKEIKGKNSKKIFVATAISF